MVVTCEIQFDNNPGGTYFAGQLISGSVMLKSDKPKEVKGVLLKVSGHALTKWKERRFQRRQLCFGREDYLSSLTYLLGSENNNRTTIQTGIHTYTFACQLPYNCPTSYEGLHGSIRYVVKVVLVRPWKFDQTYTRGFTVLKTMDLNFEPPQIRLPANSQAYKTFCCGPCKTEPLKMDLHLPQSGFVPGQIIPVTAIIANNTNMQVSSVNFWLVMQVRYHSQSPKRTIVERIVVNKAKGDAVLRNCTRSITANLMVPATPPTCLNLCSLVQIAYQVEVEAKVNSIRGSQTMIMPVTIGNVPIQTAAVIMHQPSSSRSLANAADPATEKPVMNGDIEMQVQASEEIATIQVAPFNSALPANLPPPSYEESMHTLRGDINEDELHAFGRNEFAPLYPVYNIPSPQPFTPNGNDGAYDNKSYEK